MEDPTAVPYILDKPEALREELERLNAEIIEANKERAQAAEYGLVVLEEKQALQLQYEELSTLYESTKRELEISANASKQVQADYERRLREVESQREQLLDEMEAREITLITKVGKLEDNNRQLERRLKQSISEQDHLSDHNAYLTTEVDRYRREVDVLKEENKKLRHDQASTHKETEVLHKEMEKMKKRLTELTKFEEECASLLEINKTLKQEVDTLQDQCEDYLVEREDLEDQTREVMQALNEEREAKTMLESRLKDESLRSPTRPSWAAESEAVVPTADENHNNHNEDRLLSIPSPTSGTRTISTPYSPKRAPSLLSELHTSFIAGIDFTELEALRKRCKEADDSITLLEKEKLTLEEKLAMFSMQQTEATSELGRMKEEYTKAIRERDETIESVKEEMLVKEEVVGQLKNKLNATTAERASMKIEVDGLKDELQRVQTSSELEVEKVQKEFMQEQMKNTELKGQVAVHDDHIAMLSNALERLEGVIYSSHNELTAMADDLKSLHKTVATLGTDGKLAAAGARELSPFGRETTLSEEAMEALSNTYYSLDLKRGKISVLVHNESHSLFAIDQLHEQLRSVRSPLEQFTKMMLERSLAQSARHIPLESQPESTASSRRNSIDMEATVNKWKAKLSHKAEEVNNLRAIMKARATTADVAISSLRSKLEGQARAYQTEVTRLKHQIKTLKKERDEHHSLRGMYAKRCEEYVVEITTVKKEGERMKLDNEEMMISLRKTIQRKLDLSRELEEYKVELERKHLIPKLLNSSRI